MTPVNPKSEGSWTFRKSQEGDSWKWSEKHRQMKDRGGETLRKETAADGQKQPDAPAQSEKTQLETGG